MVSILNRHMNKMTIMCGTSCLFLIVVSWCCWHDSSTEPVFAKNDYKALFPKNSIVDISDGSTDTLFKMINKNYVTFVMFYAPWSGQCIKLVPELLKMLALLNNTMVSVIAINCWVGRCKNLFQTLYFPRMFLYHSKHDPIEYFFDVNAEKILEFIQHSIRPWVYIGNESELVEFLSKYDSNAISYMNPDKLEISKIYDVFFLVALSLVNRVNGPKIGIIINEHVAAIMKLSWHGEICSRNVFREDLFYLQSANYTMPDILHWIILNNKQVVNFLSPNASYANFYVDQLRRGPAVILPLNILSSSDRKLSMYQNVAVNYYHCNCGENDNVIQDCRNTNKSPVCFSFISKQKLLCSLCQQCIGHCFCRPITSDSAKKYVASNHVNCASFLSSNHFIEERFSKCCVSISLIKSKKDIIRGKMNYTEPTNNISKSDSTLKLASYLLNHLLIEMSRADEPSNKKKHSANSRLICGEMAPCCYKPERHRNRHNLDFKGLACHTNRTLSFYVMDIHRHDYILNNIGFNNRSGMVIVDMKAEEKFHLDVTITSASIENFILQFTLGQLQQKYTSTQSPPSSNVNQHNDLEIIELTSSSFHDAVFQNEKNVFVMFYAAWCGVCKSVNLIFLNLAKVYKEVVFQRIDADVNNLSWQFIPNYYPSFILFPGFRKDSSIPYPDDEEITLNNFVTFLDSHLIQH